jgi:hypothetical protein
MARPRNKPVEPVVVSSIPVDEVEETPAVEETPSVEMPKVKEVKIIKVYCTNNSLWHPFQAKYIPINPEHAVPVIEDNWLKSQMKANLVKEV